MPKTELVSILIAIDHEGNWVATGSSEAEYPDEEKEWINIDSLSEHMSYHRIRARIPVPEERTFDGFVE